MKHSEVFPKLQKTFNCHDPHEYFELLEEPERKPKFKRLSDRYEDNLSVGSQLSTPDASSVEAVPGGRVLPLAFSSDDSNPMLTPGSGKKVETMGSGTLTMFCCKNEQHYALTCSHVGCVTDEKRSQKAFNRQENIQEEHDSLSHNNDKNANRQKYYYEEGSEQNDDTASSSDAPASKPLGIFHKCHFDDQCDIMSVKITESIEINCQVADVPPPDWNEIWIQLHDRVIKKPDPNPVKVEKICLSSTCPTGRIVATNINYYDVDGAGDDARDLRAFNIDHNDNNVMFYDTTIVKGDSGSFLRKGESGSLVRFFDKKEKKKVFAYGVLEAEKLLLPGHESPISDGPYAVCLSLETALDELGFDNAGCFDVCGGKRTSSSVSSRSPGCDIL